MRIETILDITGGSLLSGTSAAAPRREVTGNITGVGIDSRTLRRGELFVPLPGTRTDGHRFIADAIDRGAAAVFAAEERVGEVEAQAAREDFRAPVIVVGDPLTALQEIAKYRMEGLSRLTRIAVTGSSGKTTTKELLGGALSRYCRTYVSGGNFNSEIGVCLEAFRVPLEAEYAVFELGINRKGEMDVLADIVNPDYALITNIGRAHIGLLGSQYAIAAEKKRIFSRFDGGQTGFIPEDTEYLAFLFDGVPGRIRTVGPKSFPGFRRSVTGGVRGSVVETEYGAVELPLPGEHNVRNFLAAAAVALEVGVPFVDIRAAAEAAAPLFGRGEIIEGPITVISDCYNANPESMREILSFFDGISVSGRKHLVLGEMRELGPFCEEAHRELGRLLGETTADRIFLFGPEMRGAFEEASHLLEGRVSWFADYSALEEGVAGAVGTGDLVLLKGSRGVELERLLDILEIDGQGTRQC
ncbi:MAG: UDP-N-acetylmuramoyl-tripeptide--D-alanyl-D-alanine ligase [Spirochaetia bacterium]